MDRSDIGGKQLSGSLSRQILEATTHARLGKLFKKLDTRAVVFVKA